MDVVLLDYIFNPTLLNNPSDKEFNKLYRQIQDSFYKNDKYEWDLKACAIFFKANNLNPDIFIDFLNTVFLIRFPYPIGRNGRKSAFEFIETLRNSPRFRIEDRSIDKFQINYSKSEYTEFLNDLRTFKDQYLPEYKHIEWLKFVYEHFDTQKSFSVIKRDYSEYRIK